MSEVTSNLAASLRLSESVVWNLGVSQTFSYHASSDTVQMVQKDKTCTIHLNTGEFEVVFPEAFDLQDTSEKRTTGILDTVERAKWNLFWNTYVQQIEKRKVRKHE